MKTIAVRKISLSRQMIFALLATAGAVILPQIFHWMGIISGTGNALGVSLLPMHLPVIIVGLLAGPLAGGIAGFLSPVISYSLTGMPSFALMPFMVIELGVYGITAGILSSVKLNSVLKVLLIQIAGRLVRAAAILTAVNALKVSTISISTIWTSIPQGIFGILLQLVLIPLIIKNSRNDK